MRLASKADTPGDVAGMVALWATMLSLTVWAGELFTLHGWSLWWAPLAVVIIAGTSLLSYLVLATTVDLIVWRHRARIR